MRTLLSFIAQLTTTADPSHRLRHVVISSDFGSSSSFHFLSHGPSNSLLPICLRDLLLIYHPHEAHALYRTIEDDDDDNVHNNKLHVGILYPPA